MKVKSLTKDIFLSYVGSQGKQLIKNVETEIPDDAYFNKSFYNLVKAGEVQIMSFGRSRTSAIVQEEFDNFVLGLFKVTDTLTGSAASGNAEPAKIISADSTGQFAFYSEKKLTLKVDDLYTEEFTIAASTYTFSNLVSQLNLTAKNIEFKSDATPSFWAETKSKGDASKIEVIASLNDANDILKFPALSTNTSTLVPKSISIVTKNPTGKAVGGCNVLCKLWDASSGGSLITDGYFQKLSKGEYDTLYTPEINLVSADDGLIELEAIKTATGSMYLEISLPEGYFLASVPSVRIAIAVA